MTKSYYSSDEIYAILEKEITSLLLIPGQYISETEIAKRFGLSRTPIRDVFKKLEYNNLIKVIPQKGTMIKPIDLSKISEYMFGREAIEVAVISKIINSITPYQLAKLELFLLEQDKIINDESVPLIERAHKFFEIDNSFHTELFRYADKELLWEIFSIKAPDYQRFRCVVAEYSNQNSLLKIYKQHKEILVSLQEKDMDKVHKIYATHVYNGMDFITDILANKSSYFII
ncbi:MAG: GntR family transcriptional regulator [Clostridia bacterium]